MMRAWVQAAVPGGRGLVAEPERPCSGPAEVLFLPGTDASPESESADHPASPAPGGTSGGTLFAHSVLAGTAPRRATGSERGKGGFFTKSPLPRAIQEPKGHASGKSK